MASSFQLNERLRSRATDLIREGRDWEAKFSQSIGDVARMSEVREQSAGWFASVRNMITALFPDPLAPYRVHALTPLRSPTQARSILEAALTDIDAGVVLRVKEAARVEIFDDFLEHAAHYLNGGKVSQAGVIAGVVFEDTVRGICDRNTVPQAGQPLEQLLAALEKMGVLLPVKVRRCRTAAHVRAKATHAQWGEFTKSDVEETITITRELLDTQLT